ncbi:hypothetical protein [Streptomyces sp. KN37]|uniref:hypothetical protein n=1 Tax=Streptomyces sp. KN37 TaxID=3090667 RepID=UPI002A74FF59|nr:hypothetical protein [Streptomyces sp. KN37]WPO76243.1 hypothetical protein R9806_36820 [Streptomyces sp. KN37]
MLAEFVVVHQPHHTVVLVFGYRDGGRRGQEPVGAAGLLGGVQPGQDVHDRGVRGVRVGGENGQGLDPAVLGVAFQEPGRAVVLRVDVVEDTDQGPARLGRDDGRWIQPGELGAGPGEVVGAGAEEGQVLDEAQDAAVELVVALLPGEQLTAGDESVGGRVQLVGGEVGQAWVVVDAVGDVVQGPAGGHLRVGQVGQLGQAQGRKAGEQQVLAERGRRVDGQFLAVRVGGAEAGVLEGLRLGLVQQQVLDSRPERGVRGELRPPLGAAGQHRPVGAAAQLQPPPTPRQARGEGGPRRAG